MKSLIFFSSRCFLYHFFMSSTYLSTFPTPMLIYIDVVKISFIISIHNSFPLQTIFLDLRGFFEYLRLLSFCFVGFGLVFRQINSVTRVFYFAASRACVEKRIYLDKTLAFLVIIISDFAFVVLNRPCAHISDLF